MNYETIRELVNKLFYDEIVGLNDIIISKCASQYDVCFVSEIEIKRDNLDFVYKNNVLKDKEFYQNIVIINKSIKASLLRVDLWYKGNEKKFKMKANNRKKSLA